MRLRDFVHPSPLFADADCYLSDCGLRVIARREPFNGDDKPPLWHVSISHESGGRPASNDCTAVLDEVVPGVVMIEDNTGVSGRVRNFWQVKDGA